MQASLTENAVTVLESRYLKRDSVGKLDESPENLFRRVARAIADAELLYGGAGDAEKWEKIFFEMMSQLYFLPNSPTLMNAGTENGQLSACFVLPVEDNLGAIFDTLKHTALIQQSGGGTGFNFSHVRPKHDIVHRLGAVASGPVSFMKIYDGATENIKQGGKRRGANMGILNIEHPDIEEFIDSKAVNHVLTNFNISVGMRDSFMHAMENNQSWEFRHPRTGSPVKKVKARALWDKIIHNAWNSGDPGLIFLDEIERKNPTPAIGTIECTNPCGEVPLLPYEPCNLGSINLSLLVKQGNGKPEVNWTKLEELIYSSIRFLDNVIEVNHYILDDIRRMAHNNRKIGLGVMGWAEMLIHLKIPYASPEAIELGGKVMKFIQEKSADASAALAKIRGNFPNYAKSIYAGKTPMRNATRTSIAPTGTISIIAGTSSSIEPLFALAFSRENVLNGKDIYDFNQLLLADLEQGQLLNNELKEAIRREGMLTASMQLPYEMRELYRTSHEISHAVHLNHQEVFQRYTDNAVSKTINMPEEASVEDIAQAYIAGWKKKLKGITIYRYGSKGSQVLNKGIQDAACKICIS